jgi:hypothetical protein
MDDNAIGENFIVDEDYALYTSKRIKKRCKFLCLPTEEMCIAICAKDMIK